MADKRIGVTLTADSSGLQRGLNLASLHTGQFARETEQAMDRASEATERARNAVVNMARSAISILAVGKVIGLADEYGQLQSRIEGATSSHAEYVAVQERLVEISGRVYRNLGDSVEMFTRTATSLRQVGFDATQATDLIATLNYALTVNAADTQKTNTVVNAFSNAIVTGSMNLTQFNSVIAASPRLQDAMAAALGVTNAELTAMVRNGGLSVDQLMRVTSQMDTLGAEADKMRTSVSDALTNARTEFGLWINDLNQATDATDLLVSGIELVVENLNLIGAVGGAIAAGYLVRSFVSMSKAGWDAAMAFRAQTAEATALRPAVVSLAQAKLATAQADLERARAATVATAAAFNSARGTAQEAAAAQAHVAARRAETVAMREAAAAKAALAAASAGVASSGRAVLAFMGGPAGLAGLAAATAAGLYLFRDSADDLGVSLTDLQGPLDDVIAKFREMNGLQRERALNIVADRIEEEARAVRAAMRALENAYTPSRAQGGLAAARMRTEFRQELLAISQAASLTADQASDAIQGLIDRHIEAVGGSERYRAELIELAATLAEKIRRQRDAEGRQRALNNVQAEGARSAEKLDDALRGVASGLAEADWNRYLQNLIDARNVIGLTVRDLGEYQAASRGANEEQARLAGVIVAQADAYKTLEKAIQDKDEKAREGAIKVLDDLAKQEAATAALTARTTTLAHLQEEIRAGLSVADAEARAEFAASEAEAAALAAHAQRIQTILDNTTPNSRRGGSRATETEGQRLLKSIEDRILALRVEAVAYDAVTQAQRELIEFEQRLATTKDASLQQSAATVRARLAEADALERQNKIAQQGRDMQKAYADSVASQNASLYESYLRLSDQVQTWAVSESDAARNLERLEQARIRDRIATEEQVLWRQLAEGESQKEIEYTQDIINGLNRQLELRQKLADLGSKAENNLEERRRVEAQVQQWGQVIDGLRQTFQDGFFAALGDKDAVSAFGDNLKRSAKTAIASAVYEAFAKPIVVRFIAEMAGMMGGSAVQQGILQQAGVSPGGVFDSVRGAWSALSGGLTSTLATGVAKIGSAIGSQAVSSFAAGMGGAMGPAAPGMAGFMSAGSMVGAAVPWVAGGLAAYQLVNSLFGGFEGETRYGGGYMVDPATGTATRTGGPSGGDSGAAATITAIEGVWSTTQTLVDRLGGSLAGLSFGAGSELSPEKGNSFVWSSWGRGADQVSHVTGRRDLSGVTDGNVVAQEFALELQRAVIRGLQAADLGGTWAEYLSQFDVSALDEAGVQNVLAMIDALVQLRDVAADMGLQQLADASVMAQARIIELSGGVDAFADNLQAYTQAFYSDAERQAAAARALTRSLEELGLEMPPLIGTADEMRASYRALVDAQDLNTDAGQRNLAMLLANARAFDSLADSAAAAAIAQQRAAAAAASAIQAEYDAIAREEYEREYAAWADASLAYQRAVDTANGAMQILSDAVNSRKRELQDAFEAEAEVIRETIRASETALRRLNALSDRLGSTLDAMFASLSPDLAQDQAMRIVAEAAAQARLTGELPDLASLENALSVVSRPSSDNYASLVEFQRDFYGAAADIGYLQELTGKQLGLDERALSTAQEQLAVLQSQHDANMAYYDAMLATAQAQLNAALGNVSATMSVEGALAHLASAIGTLNGTQRPGPAPTPPAPTPQTPEEIVAGWYENILGFQDPDGSAYWAEQIRNKGRGDTFDDFIWSAQHTGSLPSFAVGTNFVPRDMIAQIHKGERIIPEADNRQLISQLARSTAEGQGESQHRSVRLEVVGLRQEVVGLRQEVKDALYAIAKSAGKTAKHTEYLRDWNDQGLPKPADTMEQAL